MNKIKVSGVIIPNDYQRVYDWMEWDATSPRKVEQKLNELDEDVTIEINSGGGSLFHGAEIYTMLRNYKHNVNVEITGVAASAASVIAMAGDNITMSPVSQMMIHNATIAAQGDYREMDSASNLLKNANQTAVNAYKIKSGLPDNELLDLMDKETWFTAHQALELGLIDAVMFEQPVQVAASFGSGLLPQEVVNKLTKELLEEQNPSDDVGGFEKPSNDRMDFLMSKLNLLKLKGDVQ